MQIILHSRKIGIMGTFSHIENLFKGAQTPQEKYEKIIELGRSLPHFPKGEKRPENIVKGCQSIVYLSGEIIDGKLQFKATSDALISAGIAALLLKAYNHTTPLFILKNKPSFIEKLSIHTSLSPGRSNGLASIYLQMQKSALKYLISIS